MKRFEFIQTHLNEDSEWATSKWVEYEIRKKFGLYTPILQGKANINEKNDQNGWVYVIGFNDHYKVGYSCDIKNRLKSYLRLPPFDIILYGVHNVGPKAFQIEQFIHELFALDRRQGEWFFTYGANPYEISKVLSKISINKTAMSSYKELHDMGFTIGTVRSIFDKGFSSPEFINKRARIRKRLEWNYIGSFLYERQFKK